MFYHRTRHFSAKAQCKESPGSTENGDDFSCFRLIAAQFLQYHVRCQNHRHTNTAIKKKQIEYHELQFVDFPFRLSVISKSWWPAPGDPEPFALAPGNVLCCPNLALHVQSVAFGLG